MSVYQGEKFRLFLKKRNISIKKAAELMNVSRQTIYQYFEAGNLNTKTVSNILAVFNADETEIFGIPSTSETKKDSTASEVTQIPFDHYMVVEYDDLATSAGYLGVADLSLLPDTKKRLVPKEYEEGKFLIVKVSGHSMDDGSSMSIPDGTEIMLKQLDLSPGERLPIRNNLFVIVSKDGVVLKQIIEHNTDEGYIRCHSYNPNFKDYVIPCSEVLQIFQFWKIVAYRPHIPDINMN